MRPWIRRYQLFLSKNVENQFWHMLGGPGLAADGWLTSAVFCFFVFGVYNIFIFCVWRLQYSYFLRLQYYYFLCLFCSSYLFKYCSIKTCRVHLISLIRWFIDSLIHLIDWLLGVIFVIFNGFGIVFWMHFVFFIVFGRVWHLGGLWGALGPSSQGPPRPLRDPILDPFGTDFW